MNKKTLSIFIDESGDFGTYESHNPFYVVSMVIHDQSVNINKTIESFKSHIANLGYSNITFHAGPLIRKEDNFRLVERIERKKLFTALFYLAKKLPINYLSTCIRKNKNDDEMAISNNLSKGISNTLRSNYDYMNSFNKIIIYYDNGQVQLTRIIGAIFTALFTNVEYRRVKPDNYVLFQIADLFCTLELINEKSHSIGISKSEHDFFGPASQFRKDYYNDLRDKKLKI